MPAFAWLVGHSSAVLTKHLRGKDGKTPYQRLFGKEVAEEGLEFGEKVRYRPPRGPGHGVLLEARWRDGAWLGRHWNGPVHYVFDLASKELKEIKETMRGSISRLYNRELLHGFGAWVERAIEQVEQQRKLHKGIMKLINREMTISFM